MSTPLPAFCSAARVALSAAAAVRRVLVAVVVAAVSAVQAMPVPAIMGMTTPSRPMTGSRATRGETAGQPLGGAAVQRRLLRGPPEMSWSWPRPPQPSRPAVAVHLPTHRPICLFCSGLQACPHSTSSVKQASTTTAQLLPFPGPSGSHPCPCYCQIQHTPCPGAACQPPLSALARQPPCPHPCPRGTYPNQQPHPPVTLSTLPNGCSRHCYCLLQPRQHCCCQLQPRRPPRSA